jgi:Family of unknown function (DUF6152)
MTLPPTFMQYRGTLNEREPETVRWLVELQAPNTVYPVGFRANMFKPGDPVTVTVNPAANGRPYGRMVNVTLADGRTLGTAFAITN